MHCKLCDCDASHRQVRNSCRFIGRLNKYGPSTASHYDIWCRRYAQLLMSDMRKVSKHAHIPTKERPRVVEYIIRTFTFVLGKRIKPGTATQTFSYQTLLTYTNTSVLFVLQCPAKPGTNNTNWTPISNFIFEADSTMACPYANICDIPSCAKLKFHCTDNMYQNAHNDCHNGQTIAKIARHLLLHSYM